MRHNETFLRKSSKMVALHTTGVYNSRRLVVVAATINGS